MKRLGLKPTKNSGATWLEKADGQNDFVICELKSTDAQSFRVQQKDLRQLEHHAYVANKTPMFAIQFINTGEVWLMAKPNDLPQLSEYIDTGFVSMGIDYSGQEDFAPEPEKAGDALRRFGDAAKAAIKADEDARKAFYNEREGKYKKNRSAT